VEQANRRESGLGNRGSTRYTDLDWNSRFAWGAIMFLPNKRPVIIATICFVLCRYASTGQAAPTFIFQPVSSSGPYVIVGQEIRIPRGGVEVELEMLACGWGGPPGFLKLGALQGSVDITGLLGAEAVPPNPGVDLHSLGSPVNYSLGIFVTYNVCTNNGRDCTTPKPPCVGGGSGEGFCVANPKVICPPAIDAQLPPIPPQIGFDHVCFGPTTGVPNIPCANASAAGYCGTVILVIPENAFGSYTLGFIDDSNFTFMVDDNGVEIEPLYFLPGTITILDCNGNGIADGVDLESGTSYDCQGNRIPDECDLADGTDLDCNANGVPDWCDVVSGMSADCNQNQIPDDCDFDSDEDGIPDVCDLCPADPNKAAPGACGCGVAETGDSDADGFQDCVDQCAGVNDNVFAPECVGAIPAVSTWGLVVMTLMLLTAMKVWGRVADA